MITLEEARKLNKRLADAKAQRDKAAAELAVAEQNLDSCITTLAEITGQEVTRENVGTVVKKQAAVLDAQKAAIEEYLG